jgi:hypothetical protein
MKRLFACVLLLASLAACAGVSAPGGGNCSKRGEVCIKVSATEPVRMDEPVTVIVTVTTYKDIPDLGISIYTYPVDAVVEGPQGWEKEAKNGVVYKGGAGWKIAAKANQPVTFTRKVRFPLQEGLFDIQVSASTPSLRAEDSLSIHLTRAGGKVYLSGTSVPATSGPLPTITPGPSPTFIPTPTRFVSPLVTPMRSQSPLATPIRPANP